MVTRDCQTKSLFILDLETIPGYTLILSTYRIALFNSHDAARQDKAMSDVDNSPPTHPTAVCLTSHVLQHRYISVNCQSSVLPLLSPSFQLPSRHGIHARLSSIPRLQQGAHDQSH